MNFPYVNSIALYLPSRRNFVSGNSVYDRQKKPIYKNGTGFDIVNLWNRLSTQLSGLREKCSKLFMGAASCRDICVLNDLISRLETAPT